MTAGSRSALLTGLLVAALTGVGAAADLTIISTVTPAKGSPTTSTQYLTGDKMRFSDGQSDTIVDLSAGRMIQVDHKKKTYFETTFEEMRAYFAQLEEMIASTPMMESMVGKVSEVTVQETSETREIAGYSCRKYVLTMGEKFHEVVWVTSELEIPVEYYDARKMLYAMMGPVATRFERLLDKMRDIGGLTLATDLDAKIMGMDASSASEATEVRVGPIPADAFAPPAGYKKKKSPFEG